MDKLQPVFRAPHLEVAAEQPVRSEPRSRRHCPSRRQRRFERRLAQRRLQKRAGD